MRSFLALGFISKSLSTVDNFQISRSVSVLRGSQQDVSEDLTDSSFYSSADVESVQDKNVVIEVEPESAEFRV